MPTCLLLLALTGGTFLITQAHLRVSHLALAVMSLATAKFLLVLYNFMDLRHAHLVWKLALTTFAVLFTAVFVIIIQNPVVAP